MVACQMSRLKTFERQGREINEKHERERLHAYGDYLID
jgi:hypothetical protein